MRICILTQPLGKNYGAIIQNYALQQILIRLGHKPITLDYERRYNKLRWILGKSKDLLFCSHIYDNISYPKYNRVGLSSINEFIHNNLFLSKPYNYISSSFISKYNIQVIIVGSDQVWRPKYNVMSLYSMFLDFAVGINIPKISYAASFGTDNWEYNYEQKIKCKELIKQFKSVSVREKSGIEICKKYFNIKAKLVLDPTLLLDKKDYLPLIKNEKKTEDGILFAYILDVTKEKKTLIDLVAKEKKLIPFIVNADDKLKEGDRVEKWLSMFNSAKFVITDSFHGTVFSIIFKVDFYTLINEERGAERIVSLLSSFDLLNRIIETKRENFAYIDRLSINWNAIYEKLDESRKISMEFLIKSLS